MKSNDLFAMQALKGLKRTVELAACARRMKKIVQSAFENRVQAQLSGQFI
jgi:hypothetical protein